MRGEDPNARRHLASFRAPRSIFSLDLLSTQTLAFVNPAVPNIHQVYARKRDKGTTIPPSSAKSLFTLERVRKYASRRNRRRDERARFRDMRRTFGDTSFYIHPREHRCKIRSFCAQSSRECRFFLCSLSLQILAKIKESEKERREGALPRWSVELKKKIWKRDGYNKG